jgi:Sec-independent protein translocase protein TatA
MIANIFGPDLGIVLVIILVVLVFGSQLPKIARNAGIAGREFRKAHQEAEEDAERARIAQTGTAAAVTPPPPPVGPAAPTHEASIKLTSSELDALLRGRETPAEQDRVSPGS